MSVESLRRYCQARGLVRGEDGVTLVLALAFITLLGAFVVALLALTQANFKTTTVTRTRIDALYTADSGADFALEQIRTTATASCPPSIAAAPAVNGITPAVSISCTAGTMTTGGSPIIGTYAAIALGSNGISVGGSTLDGDNLTIKFQGDVYSAGNLDPVLGTGNSLAVIGDASVAASTCSYNSTTDPQVMGSCLAAQPAPAVGKTSPSVVVPSNTAPASKKSGRCTILYPGKYTSAPTFAGGQGFYLASGTYYFNGTGDISFGGWIRGGAPGAITPTLSSGFDSACPASFASDVNAKTLEPTYNSTGSGATIILGGNAALRYTDNQNTNVELFPRVPSTGSPDLAATPGVSIWGQVSSTTGATASYTTMTPAPPYFTTGKISSVVTHGLTWLPDSQLSVAPLPNVDAAGAAQFRGGVVANSLVLVPQNLAGGLMPIIAGTSSIVAGPRSVTITSVATPTGGGATTTIKVVATYPPTANSYPTIVSWRKV